MFDFDRWRAWLRQRAFELERQGLPVTFSDNCDAPETQSNPSFGLEIETAEAIGWIRFWQIGTCDYEFAAGADEGPSRYEAMLEANDATVEPLVERFIALFPIDNC